MFIISSVSVPLWSLDVSEHFFEELNSEFKDQVLQPALGMVQQVKINIKTAESESLTREVAPNTGNSLAVGV